LIWLDELCEDVSRVCCPACRSMCLGWPTIQLTDDHGVDLTFNCDYHGDFVVRIAPVPDTSGNVVAAVRWAAGNSRQRSARRLQHFGFEGEVGLATSKAQAYWARSELAKTKAGGYQSTCGYDKLKALAATPLDGLPERAPKKGTKAN
jgi:hypothetical protein